MDSKISPREQWTSKLGFILAAAGSAVGLGNLWGFAYRASQGGGAAFVLLYILIVLIVCLPVFVAEMALGRNATASTLLAPVKLAGKNWYPLGILFFIAPLGIASYYSVIMGWTADTMFHSLFFGLPKNLITRKIIFPQALRVIIPPLTSQYLNLTKNSSLAVAIGYQDIVSVGDTVLNQSGHALEVVAIFMVFYLTLSLLTSLFMNWYNARIALVER